MFPGLLPLYAIDNCREASEEPSSQQAVEGYEDPFLLLGMIHPHAGPAAVYWYRLSDLKEVVGALVQKSSASSSHVTTARGWME